MRLNRSSALTGLLLAGYAVFAILFWDRLTPGMVIALVVAVICTIGVVLSRT